MTIIYPDITILDNPNIEDKEVLYWTHRVSELRNPLIQLFSSLLSHYDTNKNTVAVLMAILKRQLEVTDTILLLAAKGKIKDSGILVLNLYELTLDLQYISMNPGYENIWIAHHEKGKKPWKVHDQIKFLFPVESEFRAEKNFYKTYSLIKHGNIAGEYIAFDFFVKEGKLAVAVTDPSFVVSNLFAVGFLLSRISKATLIILKSSGIFTGEDKVQTNELYSKFIDDFKVLVQLKTIEMQYPYDLEKQKEVVNKLNLSF